MNLTADGLREGGRAAGGADQQGVAHHGGGVAGDSLLERAIEDGAGVFAAGLGFDVTDDADEPVKDACAGDLDTDRVAAAKDVLDEGLIDDADHGAGRSLGTG